MELEMLRCSAESIFQRVFAFATNMVWPSGPFPQLEGWHMQFGLSTLGKESLV